MPPSPALPLFVVATDMRTGWCYGNDSRCGHIKSGEKVWAGNTHKSTHTMSEDQCLGCMHTLISAHTCTCLYTQAGTAAIADGRRPTTVPMGTIVTIVTIVTVVRLQQARRHFLGSDNLIDVPC